MRKGPIIHGVLLVVVLVVAYQTWTRDEKAEPKTGDVVVWKKSVDDIEAIVFETEQRKLRVERRGEGDESYLWGIETHTTAKPVKPKPPEPKKPEPAEDEPNDAKPDDAKPGDAKPGDAKPGDAKPDDAKPDQGDAEDEKKEEPPEPEPEPETETVTNTREFAIGEAGEEMFQHFAEMRALLALGKVTDEETLKEYGLDEGTDTISVVFGDETKSLIYGGKVRGSIDHYLMDPQTSEVWLVAGAVVQPLATGETGLKIQKLHAFDDETLAKVTISAVGKTRDLVRLTVPDEKGNPTNTWADADTPDTPDQTMANLVKRLDDLRPARFEPEMTTEGLDERIAVTYFDTRGNELGTLTLYKKVTEREPPPELEPEPEPAPDEATDGGDEKPADGEKPAEGDEAAEEPPPKPEHPPLPPKIEYYLQSELTRVIVSVSRTAAERIDQDLDQIFE